jgi:hypothetical protein
MLDECRGERLEEVLAVFSSAVLKRMVALTSPDTEPLAVQLALENCGYHGDRTELDILTLAYRVTCRRRLAQKQLARRQYRDFSELLNLKDRRIVRRHEQLNLRKKSDKEHIFSDGTDLETWRLVRNNWSGNERWMETLIYGDINSNDDSLFTHPFEKVWRKVQSGRLSELDNNGKGMIEQMENRVSIQKERLRKWESLRSQVAGPVLERPQRAIHEPQTKKGINFNFGAHKTMGFGRCSPRKPISKMSHSNETYSRLLDECWTDLNRVCKIPKVSKQTTSSRIANSEESSITALTVNITGEEELSELSELEDHSNPDIATYQSGPHQRPQHEQTEQDSILDQKSNHSRPHSKSTAMRLSILSPVLDEAYKLNKSVHDHQTPLATAKLPVQDDEVNRAVDQVNFGSPISKPRHTLSLAERTRLSMARMSRASLAKQLSEDEEDAVYPLPKSSGAMKTVTDENDGDENGDLVARTRRSMSGFEAARQKAQLERRKSQRKSRAAGRKDDIPIPKAEEESDNLGVDASNLAEELMEQDDDYAAVFKSRPRVKTSPVPSRSEPWTAE